MALMLIAAAAYCAVRSAGNESGATRWLLLIPVVLLAANAVKYASALFDPVVVGLAGLLIAQQGSKRVAERVMTLSAVTVLLLAAAVSLAGTAYLKGVLVTTITRQSAGIGPLVGLSSATPSQIIAHSLELDRRRYMPGRIGAGTGYVPTTRAVAYCPADAVYSSGGASHS
jgi:hypothetical protein